MWLLLATMMLLCTSCYQSDFDQISPLTNSEIIQVQVSYTNPDASNFQHPDAQSRVFVFLGHYSTEYSNYSYVNGKLVKENQIVSPDMSAVTDDSGKATLQLKSRNIPITILVESNYTKRVTMDSFSPSQKEIALTIIHKCYKE